MDEKQFATELKKHNIQVNERQLEQFSTYFQQLNIWNKKVNLTAITEKKDVYLKHFYDSLTAAMYVDIKKHRSMCDVGAGAGFPSIPLKIVYPELKITIVDSLKKRIDFLN